MKEKDYVMVRTFSAGVFAGYLKKRNGKEVELDKARRIWYWAGANSLSQLAMTGTNQPESCKFSVPVDEMLVTEAIEIIKISETAKKNIQAVPEWKQ